MAFLHTKSIQNRWFSASHLDIPPRPRTVKIDAAWHRSVYRCWSLSWMYSLPGRWGRCLHFIWQLITRDRLECKENEEGEKERLATLWMMVSCTWWLFYAFFFGSNTAFHITAFLSVIFMSTFWALFSQHFFSRRKKVLKKCSHWQKGAKCA